MAAFSTAALLALACGCGRLPAQLRRLRFPGRLYGCDLSAGMLAELCEELMPPSSHAAGWLIPAQITKRLRATGLVMLLLAMVGAYCVGLRTGTDVPNNPLVVDKGLDLGSVWESDHLAHTLVIRNPTEKEVVVNEFASSCSCLHVAPSSLQLAPGATAELRLTLDLTRGKVPAAKSAWRDVVFQLFPRMADDKPGAAPVSPWMIRGRARPALVPSSPVVAFEKRIVLDGFRTPQRTITIKPLISIEAIEVNVTKPLVKVRLARRAGEFELLVTPDASAPAGPLNCEIDLVGVCKNGNRLPALRLPVIGQVEFDVHVVPATLLFGLCPIGGVEEAVVLLNSASGTAFEIDSIHPDQGITVESVGPQVPSQRRFRLREHVTNRTARNKVVEFCVVLGGQRRSVLLQTHSQGYDPSPSLR